jgi:putative endonuclease
VDPQRLAGRIFGFEPARAVAEGRNLLRSVIKRMREFARRDAPPRDYRAALGAKGERMAVRRLRRNGYRILARNYRGAGAEIDAVAIDRDTLVFVEVKTRLSFAAGRPEDAVNGLKQNQLRRAAAVFARHHRMEQWPIRFDVVAISRQDGRWEMEIIKDAF